ncbi:cation diffusion facilitator family metal ion transporter [Penicillium longicatenatum]|nr:cation diffusion facilitator family metal ion transporter [Penicillium longicatenatum]
MPFRFSRSTRLYVVIAISTCFFLGEISVGFYTHSLALIADAFHYLNDLVGFIIALVALKVSENGGSPAGFSFGWQRAQLLGAFFNGVLLFALGISIFLQSIERFIALQRIEDPKLVLIIGCIGLGLNIISVLFLHEHGHDDGHDHGPPAIEVEDGLSPISDDDQDSISKHHDHKHVHPEKPNTVSANFHDHGHSHDHGHGHDHGDLGMMGVLIHVLCDAANNLGVIAAALVIWLAKYDGRYYADPGVSMGIAFMIIFSSVPLIRRSGLILLESAPVGLDLSDVQHDLEKVPGVHSVHELHIWRLNQQKTLASVHVVVSDPSVSNFLKTAKTINECFHAYGIHSATLQPEALSEFEKDVVHPHGEKSPRCQVVCGTLCEGLTCCG